MDFVNLNQNKLVRKKIQELKYRKFEVQNYLLELQPYIAREAFKVRGGMTDVQTNYSNKYSCHLCPVCKLEKETASLVASNVNMSLEGFRNIYLNEGCDIELVPVAVRESAIDTRNRFT